MQIIKNRKEKSRNIKKIINHKNIHDEDINIAIKELLKYIDNEGFISNVKATLITRGSEDKKVTFNIEEVEESIVLNSDLNRNRDINATETVE